MTGFVPSARDYVNENAHCHGLIVYGHKWASDMFHPSRFGTCR